MPEQALQVAFEIKTACDEISRRLLRWHWERKPGAHSLDALLEHIAARKQESPDYYDRMPDLTGKTSWQQLDTTLCMRVLLDPETCLRAAICSSSASRLCAPGLRSQCQRSRRRLISSQAVLISKATCKACSGMVFPFCAMHTKGGEGTLPPPPG